MPPTIMSTVLASTISPCSTPSASPVAIRFGVPPTYTPMAMPAYAAALGR